MVDITADGGCLRIDNNIPIHKQTHTHEYTRIIIIYGKNVFDLFIFTRGEYRNTLDGDVFRRNVSYGNNSKM